MARVFISHSSVDALLAGQVHQWLTHDGHKVFLDQDLADGIAIGEDWQQRLHERLRWADAVVCLITASYVSSPWCTAEVAIAQARGSRLLPVQVDHGMSHPLLTSVQHVDLNKNGIEASGPLASTLRRLDAAGGGGWADNRSPFPGLRSFDITESRVFFGRSREINELSTLLRSPAEQARGAIKLVVGPSGCGKSSLVRAGLLSAIAAEPGWQTVPAITPGQQPVTELVRELAVAARQAGASRPIAEIRRKIKSGGIGDFAEELLLSATGQPRQLLIVVDQFEELLTQCQPAERSQFAEILGAALAGPVQIVATLRPEFLDRLLLSSEFAALPKNVYPLQPLRRESLRAVIEGPAQLAGIGVDEDLVARLMTDTAHGEALPLLAFTLAQLAN